MLVPLIIRFRVINYDDSAKGRWWGDEDSDDDQDSDDDEDNDETDNSDIW